MLIILYQLLFILTSTVKIPSNDDWRNKIDSILQIAPPASLLEKSKTTDNMNTHNMIDKANESIINKANLITKKSNEITQNLQREIQSDKRHINQVKSSLLQSVDKYDTSAEEDAILKSEQMMQRSAESFKLDAANANSLYEGGDSETQSLIDSQREKFAASNDEFQKIQKELDSDIDKLKHGDDQS